MNYATDVLIIGGGVIGTSIAYNLRKLGVDVALLEKGEVGSQASSAAAGLLAPLGPLSGPGPLADLLLASFAMFPSLVPELEEASGIHLEYERSGSLRTVRNPKRIANLQKRMDVWGPLGFEMYWLTGEEARQREPLLGPDVCAAIYAPEEAQIKAPQFVKAFARAAKNLGAAIYEQTEVTQIQRQGSKITGVSTIHGETINCNHLILASGAWSVTNAQWFNLTIPISPVRGQILLLQAPSPQLKHVIFGNAIYIAPKGGTVLVGATKEEAAFEIRVTEEGISWLHNTASQCIPALAQSERIAAWAGLRPCTPDRGPLLGPVPRWENLTLATGHNSVGILLSPLTGQAIAQTVTTGNIPKIIRPFLPGRFASLALPTPENEKS